ncbi:MAK10-like protein, partial [Tanacetum coccineum]
MGDANPIRTLGDYSKPSHEGYRNTIELPERNNVVPLRSDTIRLVQNGFSFHGHWFEDPNQHLKDFLKLVDSLDLDDANRETRRMRLFQFSFSDQASNWLERLPVGSISTWEDLTTRFLAQFFPPRRTAKLRNDIMMFQQHQGESLSEAWTHFKDLLQKVPHHAHTERKEIFENAIFKQREEINHRMAEMFGIFKELITSRAPEKVMIREEAKYPVTKNSDMEMPVKKAEKENEAENGTKNDSIKRAKREEVVEAPSYQHVGYYLKHMINEKLIEGLVDNYRFNDSMLGVQVGKMKGKTYNLLPKGPVYEVILKKKITRKEDIREKIKIPCNIGDLKHMNALVDQGSNVNIMPLSTYLKLTDKRYAETDVRLSLASHSYIYPLGIAEDVLVDVAGYVYPMDFMILDIREDEKRPFILGTPFLTTVKAVIKFDRDTINLRSGKSKISFQGYLNPL